MKGIPGSEKIWTEYRTSKGTFFVTSKNDNTNMFFLYHLEDDKAKKLGKAKSPTVLERQYIFNNQQEKKK